MRIPYYDPPDWEFHERHSLGLKKAWKRDVGLDDRQFVVGVSGPRRAPRVTAYDFAFADSHGNSGRVFYYENGRWTQKQAPVPRTIWEVLREHR